jgi:hypothetical protein
LKDATGRKPGAAQVEAPSLELVRLAMLLVSSRGAIPLKPAQAEALGAAILKASQSSLVEIAGRALQEAHAALALGRNWLEGLERIPAGSRFGQQLQGLSRSMAKTMHRNLTSATEALGFGIAGQVEPLEPGVPGYKEVPAFADIARREGGTELERAHDALRVARFGILKLARFAHALSLSPAARTWDDALAQAAAQTGKDIGAHLAALARFIEPQEKR